MSIFTSKPVTREHVLAGCALAILVYGACTLRPATGAEPASVPPETCSSNDRESDVEVLGSAFIALPIESKAADERSQLSPVGAVEVNGQFASSAGLTRRWLRYLPAQN
jgi:hypothetical protein